MSERKKKGIKATNELRKLLPLLSKLDRAIENKKYLERKLTLSSLAHDLGSNRTYLSDLIHIQYKMSFTQYINGLRIAEAKRLLELQPAELMDEDGYLFIKNVYMHLGYNCGTSFYRNFKRVTGMSATEYLEKIELEKLEKEKKASKAEVTATPADMAETKASKTTKAKSTKAKTAKGK